VIVSIGLDHTAILGETIELIAKEKAGIIKPGRPVVIGDLPPGAKSIVAETAKEKGSQLLVYGEDFHWQDRKVTTANGEYGGLQPGITGERQGHNLAVAIQAMEAANAIIDPDKLALGAATTRLPGRFENRQHCGRTFILDGAHNAQAAEHLVATLKENGFTRALTLIAGRLEGHDTKAFFDVLTPMIERAHIAKIDFFRTMDPTEVIRQAGLQNASPHDSAASALAAAINDTKEGETILVTGSFYLVGEVGSRI
jgi:dihydrofolate synthase/folylpolyglutamate synthase